MSSVGTCKYFNDEKGFGFITTSTHGDVFCHRSKCQGGQPREGDTVQFDMETDQRNGKLMAVNVTGGTAPLGGPGGSGGGGGFGGGGKGYGGGGAGFGGGGYDAPAAYGGGGFGGGGFSGGGYGGGGYGGGGYGDAGGFGGGYGAPSGYGAPPSYGGGGGGKGFGGGDGGGGPQVCRQFQQGSCSYGDRCRYAHQ